MLSPSARSLPFLPLRGLDFDHLRSDLVAGTVVGVIAIPLSIALAVAVGIPPAVGLYTAAFAGASAAIFGGSEFNITGPTAALVPILSHATLVHGAEASPLIGLMAGLILVAMSLLRLGNLMRFMPGPVILGFTAGIALSIFFGQLNNFLGVTGIDPGAEHFHEKLGETIANLQTVGWATPLSGVHYSGHSDSYSAAARFQTDSSGVARRRSRHRRYLGTGCRYAHSWQPLRRLPIWHP